MHLLHLVYTQYKYIHDKHIASILNFIFCKLTCSLFFVGVLMFFHCKIGKGQIHVNFAFTKRHLTHTMHTNSEMVLHRSMTKYG